jgi:hypothetical protein
MTDKPGLLATVQKLRELMAKATIPPWEILEGRPVQVAHITRDVWHIPMTTEDSELIVAMRNALPELLEAVDPAYTDYMRASDADAVALVEARKKIADLMAAIQHERQEWTDVLFRAGEKCGEAMKKIAAEAVSRTGAIVEERDVAKAALSALLPLAEWALMQQSPPGCDQALVDRARAALGAKP